MKKQDLEERLIWLQDRKIDDAILIGSLKVEIFELKGVIQQLLKDRGIINET